MVKDVVGIIASFDALEKGIEIVVAVVELGPMSVGEHVVVGVVDVAALVACVVVGRAFVAGMRLGAGVEIGVKVVHPSETSCVVVGIRPIALELQLHDGGALRDCGFGNHLWAIDGAPVGVDCEDGTLKIEAWDVGGQVLVEASHFGGAEVALHIAGFVFGSMAGADAAADCGIEPWRASDGMRAGAGHVCRSLMMSGEVCSGTGVFRCGWTSDRVAGLEEVQELVEDTGIVAGSVGIAELSADNDLIG